MQKQERGLQRRKRPIALAMAVLGAGSNAFAFEIDVGNEDIEMRLDTTIRYNAGVRVKNRNNLIGNNIASDEGTYLFDKGDLVTNRLDLFSEFDFAWKKQLGFRLTKGTEFDQEPANFLGAVEAAKMIPLGPKHAVIGYEALGNVSSAVKAALESATAPQGAENRSALIGYFNTEASGAAAPVATLPAADGAGFCNVYLGAVAPSYRVDGKVVQRRVGTGSRGKVASSVTSSAPDACTPSQ